MFFVLEDDKRGQYLSDILLENNFYVTNDPNDLKYSDYIYLGMKGIDSQNRVVSNKNTIALNINDIKKNAYVFTLVKNKFLDDLSRSNKFKYYFLLDNSSFLNLNTILTSEGLISFMVEKINKPLYCSKILILGYGRCSKEISKRLINFNCDITIAVRKEELKKEIMTKGYKFSLIKNINLNDYDYVINTIPSVIIDKERLTSINKKVTFFDIASFPYGIDHHEAIKLGFESYIVSSIPNYYYPIYSAELIYKTILERIGFDD